MATRRAKELLYDSEASLRLVDNVLDELREDTDDAGSQDQVRQLLLGQLQDPTSQGISALPRVLLRAYAEIMSVLESLKQSRGVLERATVEKLAHTNDKLREVSSATEVAATDILDGLDRALKMVDDLDAEPGSSEKSVQTRTKLREEIFGVMSCLQFQDITTQQLTYASTVLVDMERRMSHIASIFGMAGTPSVVVTVPETAAPAGPVNYDPAASNSNAGERQAMADEIFKIRRK